MEKTLESSLDSKEIKLVNPKGNQPWIFIGRSGAEAPAPILWPPDARSQLIGKYCDAGQDGRQEEKGATEDKMVGCHHQLNWCEFEKTSGDSGGQRSLACYRPFPSLLFPSPWDLPYPGIKPVSLSSSALGTGFFTTSAIWETPSIIDNLNNS